MPLTDTLRKELTDLVSAHDVVLFMKGTRQSPACGFSAQVVQILDEILPTYETVNVLASPEIRDGIKELSEWPTIPQLYVKGKFVGGCDIVRELHGSGELEKVLGTDASAAPPSITLTAAALAAFREASDETGDDVLRFGISPRFEYELYFGPKAPNDVVVDASGLTLHLDRGSARRADGARIDFIDGPQGAGFRVDNPSEPPRVKTMTVVDLKRLLDAKEPLVLIDVRPDKERAIAQIAGSKPLHAVDLDHLDKRDRIVVHCHHGGRSEAVAEHLVTQGFRNVFNLRGGVDAWSTLVDTSIPRY
jgi:monothiol glutaredoxin